MTEGEKGQLRDLVRHMERRLHERYALPLGCWSAPAVGDLRQTLATLRTIDRALQSLPRAKREAVVKHGMTFETLDTNGLLRVSLARHRTLGETEQTFTNGDDTGVAHWLQETS